jgi:group I intron endonuclease
MRRGKSVANFVYVIQNRKNCKLYVGQTIIPPSYRWTQHLRNARNGCNFPLHRAIRKYGKEEFIISVIVCKSKREMDSTEKFLIRVFEAKDKDFGYNVADGGEGGAPFSGHTHSERSKIRIRKALKGKPKPVGFGEKISKALTGKPKSPEHRAKLAGKNNPMYGRIGPLNPMFGKKRPDLAEFNRNRARRERYDV